METTRKVNRWFLLGALALFGLANFVVWTAANMSPVIFALGTAALLGSGWFLLIEGHKAYDLNMQVRAAGSLVMVFLSIALLNETFLGFADPAYVYHTLPDEIASWPGLAVLVITGLFAAFLLWQWESIKNWFYE